MGMRDLEFLYDEELEVLQIDELGRQKLRKAMDLALVQPQLLAPGVARASKKHSNIINMQSMYRSNFYSVKRLCYIAAKKLSYKIKAGVVCELS
eukprot:4224854-Amphidinium_carterae.1